MGERIVHPHDRLMECRPVWPMKCSIGMADGMFDRHDRWNVRIGIADGNAIADEGFDQV
jgi:hypothetical protein